MNSTRKSTARKSKSRKTSDALEIVEKNLIGDDEELQALVEAATLNASVSSSALKGRNMLAQGKVMPAQRSIAAARGRRSEDQSAERVASSFRGDVAEAETSRGLFRPRLRSD